MAVANDNIDRFWRWFSEHEFALADANIPQALIADLEARLFAIHPLDWEMGPGRNAPNFFALSPRGDPQVLQVAKQIVARAPILVNWEFYPAKPPRNWNLRFSLMIDDRSVEIDGKRWEFVAYRFKDGSYDLVFKPDCDYGVTPDYLQWAATIIADGELGEETRMTHVPNIEVVMSLG